MEIDLVKFPKKLIITLCLEQQLIQFKEFQTGMELQSRVGGGAKRNMVLKATFQ
jgi:hypothetical protein